MSLSDDVKLGVESIPLIVVLAQAIVKVVNAKSPTEELDALMDASEAMKFRMDQLKFPNESQED